VKVVSTTPSGKGVSLIINGCFFVKSVKKPAVSLI